MYLKILCAFLLVNLSSTCFGANKTINLVVAYKNVSYTGQTRKAISINNQVPGPVLHFKQGDNVTINVYNRLDKPTTIHWHGILVPWQMDGVEGVSQEGIPPGGVFHYKFSLHQSGTYWYHAHAGLQEQQGLYGAIVIDPITSTPYSYNKDYVIVLSDWINTAPEQVLANLKKDGDYYAPRFPLQPSLMKFIHDYSHSSFKEKKILLNDYLSMQRTRMGIYDLSDVAYDAFLLNGHAANNPWIRSVKVGDIVRLRFIGASAGTIFQVKIPHATMQMVHAQGNDVRPYKINNFTIAPGETYDVLVKITNDMPYIIYAEARDKVGAAYGALTTSSHQFVNFNVTPFPEPLPVTREMMENMMGDYTSHATMTHPMSMQHSSMQHASMPMQHASMPMKHSSMSMQHSKMSTMSSHHMDMPTEPSIIGDKLTAPEKSYKTSNNTKYQNLIAQVKTNNPNKPVNHTIKMELFGYMNHFIWFINGVPEYKAHPIELLPGQRYRIIFINNSMMHHPMHIHGHWFILRKGNAAYDPLLHTIDVPPGATMTADVDTDASGQWFFHCHLLYHMVAGMSRVFQYSTLIEITRGAEKPENIIKNTAYHNRPIVRIDEVRPINISLVNHPMAHPAGLWLASFIDFAEDPFHNVQDLTFKGLYGPDYNKLELLTKEAELDKGTVQNADIDIFYWHLLSQFWAIKGGVNYFNRPAIVPYWQPGIGIEGVMPYFIDTDVRAYYYHGSTKLDVELSRDTQITNNFFIRLSVRSILASKTIRRAQLGSGLNQMRYDIRPYYRLIPGLNVFVQYEYQRNYGDFRALQLVQDESASQNTLSLGFSLLF